MGIDLIPLNKIKILSSNIVDEKKGNEKERHVKKWLVKFFLLHPKENDEYACIVV